MSSTKPVPGAKKHWGPLSSQTLLLHRLQFCCCFLAAPGAGGERQGATFHGVHYFMSAPSEKRNVLVYPSSGSAGKESASTAKRPRFDLWVGKIPWRRQWQPTPVFLPGESHRQRSLAGYSPWGCKELDRTERLSEHTHTHIL